MTSAGVPIGVAAIHSGVKVPTIRYYEEIGLLPAPPRTRSNRRHYDAHDVRRLGFIRHARQLGFEIEAIRALLTIQDNPDQPCEAVDVIARARLCEVERRIGSLVKLKAELERMIVACSRGRVAECRIIEVLATPQSGRPDDMVIWPMADQSCPAENGSGYCGNAASVKRRAARRPRQGYTKVKIGFATRHVSRVPDKGHPHPLSNTPGGLIPPVP